MPVGIIQQAKHLQRLLRPDLGPAADPAQAVLRRSWREYDGAREGVLAASFGIDRSFLERASAALTLSRYRQALSDLRSLIEESAAEGRFQDLLSRNPWMFGSEYSALESRRRWTRDETKDFMLRRTSDGYPEIIEIKTPLEGASLFNKDFSHRTLYPNAEISKIIAQVENYLEQIDRKRDTIHFDDNVDMNKVRAKIVIGRDLGEAHRKALRRLNGHLHRIEVITYDGLLRIAERVLAYLEEPKSTEEVPTVP